MDATALLDAAVGILRLLGPASVFSAMYFFVASYVLYEKRTGLLSTVTLSVAVVQVGLTFWFVRMGGAEGVAAATLLSMAIYLAHVLFSAGTRIALEQLGVESIDMHVLAGTLAGVAGPVAMYFALKRFGLTRLFGFGS